MPTSPEAPPEQWLLIRGLARESRHWGDFPELLRSRLGPRARVDAIDLPGTGRFSEMRSPTSIDAITEFARTRFLELRSRRRDAGEESPAATYLVALSLGGMVASCWMERWPRDFAGCVLVNTSFRGFSPVLKRLSPSGLSHLGRIIAAKSALTREERVLAMVSNRVDLRAKTAREWEEIQHDRPVSAENFARQLLAAARFRPTLERPPVPVLVLSSERDRMVDPECSEVIAKRWGAPIIKHPSAGHDLTLDDGAWAADRIAEWHLAGNVSARA